MKADSRLINHSGYSKLLIDPTSYRKLNTEFVATQAVQVLVTCTLCALLAAVGATPSWKR